jgi:DNA-binding NtrC family response regulator
VSEILIASGNKTIAAAVAQHLAGRGHSATISASGAECLDRLSVNSSDLVVACLPLGDVDGATFLRRLRSADGLVPVVVMGNDGSISGAVEAFELGAFEFLTETLPNPAELLAAVGVALGSRRHDVQLRYLREKDGADARWQAMVGECVGMQEVLRVVRQLCDRTARGGAPTILIHGETGTGKGMLAKVIHYNGGRRTRAFVEVNCAAIPDTLIEAELFGHERGAFTDARMQRQGLFETAHEGTLFLDEIGSVPLPVQAKLLTAIEEKRVRRVGGRESIMVDVQIVTATHSDLKRAVRAGSFREDLYHRLNVVALRLPPLRERGSDKVLLAEKFVASMCREYGISPRRFSDTARRHIIEYPWPGNVRELRNQIERILLLSNDSIIDGVHFDIPRTSSPPDSDRFVLTLPDEGVALADIEQRAIRSALDRFEGNVSRAARFLHISRQTLIYRMKKYGMSTPPPSSSRGG